MAKKNTILDSKGNLRKFHSIKSFCVGGRLLDNYLPENFTEVKAEVDKYVAVNNSKSIIRMRGENTINYQGFIYWN